MKKQVAANKSWWNKVVPIHSNSQLYNLENFKKGKTSLHSIELKEIGNVKNKELLHLMCHFGQDTLSWSRLGAKTTGVDISDKSIEFAKNLSQEIQVPSNFICCDVYDLPKHLNKKFDIIFCSYGVILWLSDLKKWAKIINQFLKKGGVFYIVDTHPFTNILSYDFKIQHKYFEKGPFRDDSDGTYANWDAKIKGTTYDWSHTLSDVMNTFIQEGLKIEYIHEFPFTMYNQFPGFMKKNEKGYYVLKNKKLEIPLLFSLKITK